MDPIIESTEAYAARSVAETEKMIKEENSKIDSYIEASNHMASAAVEEREAIRENKDSELEKESSQSKIDSDMKFAQEAQSAAAEIAEAQNQGISM